MTPAEHAATLRDYHAGIILIDYDRGMRVVSDAEAGAALAALLALAERATELEADLEAAGRWKPGATRRLAEAEARATELEILAAERARERDEDAHSLNHCRGLLEAVEARATELEAERDAVLKMVSAQQPPDEVFRYFQRLHGLPEVGAPIHPAEARATELETVLRFFVKPDGGRKLSIGGIDTDREVRVSRAQYERARAALGETAHDRS